MDCQRCDGPTAGNLLLSPLALASGRDGALYIGDYNYIRRLSPSRDSVATILQLRYDSASLFTYQLLLQEAELSQRNRAIMNVLEVSSI